MISRIASRWFAAIGFVAFLNTAVAAERIVSKYTSTAERESISLKNGPEETGSFSGIFRGFGGYQIAHVGDDERSWINIKFGKTTVDLREATMEIGTATGSFPHKANGVVEWRGVDEKGGFKPHAVIYRLVGLDENGKRKRTRLIVIKLNKERSAVIGFAEGGPNDEKEAYAIADKAH
ncbi:MAG: hypothetical protein V7609_1082 [Verrucomicrobiota bacterium]